MTPRVVLAKLLIDGESLFILMYHFGNLDIIYQGNIILLLIMFGKI